MMGTIGNLNYNGVVVKLMKTENGFLVAMKYSKSWRDAGRKNVEYFSTDENMARMVFRDWTKEAVSIY